MTLGIVARYSTLLEAEVACSALCSAGFHAAVLERCMASIIWTRQIALGGVRVAVPEPELEDAVGYLSTATRTWRPRPRRRDRGWAWRLFALALGLLLLPEAGWLVIGWRDRTAKGSALGLLGVTAVTLAMTSLLVLLVLGIFWRPDDRGVFHPQVDGY